MSKIYKYAPEEWARIRAIREEEDRAMRVAFAEDMDNWNSFRQEEHEEDRVELSRDNRRVA
jgi:hypothetical protein